MNKVHYTTLFSEEDLKSAVEQKLVTKRKHPTHPLYIYNYSASAVFAWKWNDATLNCRGLVLDADGFIIGRSFKKFFSYEQLNGVLPEGKFVVEEKLDGSMLLVFKYNGEFIAATRGSFESEQAVDARRFLNEKQLSRFVDDGITLVFEYISHLNKIVCRYDYEGLVLLAAIDNESGEDIEIFNEGLEFKRPKIYTFNELDEILNYEEDNIEGFVLHYADNSRVKSKTALYKELHKYITGVSEKTIWESLKNGTFYTWLEKCPDEMYGWVTEIKETLETQYKEIERSARDNFVDFGNRKENALHYQNLPNPGILFSILDGKDYSQTIWKLICPKTSRVFKIVLEDSN